MDGRIGNEGCREFFFSFLFFFFFFFFFIFVSDLINICLVLFYFLGYINYMIDVGRRMSIRSLSLSLSFGDMPRAFSGGFVKESKRK